MNPRYLAPSLYAILWVCSAAPSPASTTLTFATVGGTGVGAASGGIILLNNPNASLMLASGSPAAATPSYGSNVSATTADGSFVVSGAGTPDIGLAWASGSVPAGTNIIEGIGKGVAGWGDAASNISNNGVGQINNLIAGTSFSVTFTPTPGKGVAIEAIDLYKSALNLTPGQGRGYRITVTGNAPTSPTTFSKDFALSTAVEAIATCSLGVAGQPGEALKLTISRPSAADELAIVKAGLGSSFTVYTGTNHHNQNGIDNLRFSEITEAAYALDTDGDGLSDFVENTYTHTNPNLADTDGDGLADGFEVNGTHTDPNVSDKGLVNYLLKQSGLPVAVRDATTGKITLRIGMAESLDLQAWFAAPFNALGTTAAPAGARLNVNIASPLGNPHFYRFTSPQP